MMQEVKIKTQPGIATGYGTQITTGDGAEIPNVTAIKIIIEPDNIVQAHVSIAVGECDITAHPLLSLESLIEAARVHGFELVPRQPAPAPINSAPYRRSWMG